jgi:hypothetical protein
MCFHDIGHLECCIPLLQTLIKKTKISHFFFGNCRISSKNVAALVSCSPHLSSLEARCPGAEDLSPNDIHYTILSKQLSSVSLYSDNILPLLGWINGQPCAQNIEECYLEDAPDGGVYQDFLTASGPTLKHFEFEPDRKS